MPAFATVREAAKRTLGQRHFDVELIGGIVLHEGDIAEMKTGEGNTMVATLAGLPGCACRQGRPRSLPSTTTSQRAVAGRANTYGFLGLTTGVIVDGLDDAERSPSNARDITYGTNEYGFDDLRDV